MSTVGLTKAREKALRDYGNASDRMLSELVRGGFLEDAPMNCYNITPRGHAALAAPRMMKKEYVFLSWIERGEWAAYSPANQRIFDSCTKQGWVNLDGLTVAGRTALNNVRAAMGSPDWKEGL